MVGRQRKEEGASERERERERDKDGSTNVLIYTYGHFCSTLKSQNGQTRESIARWST